MEIQTMKITCPSCGKFADVPVEVLDALHSGVTIECSECSKDIVFIVKVFTKRQYRNYHNKRFVDDIMNKGAAP